MNEIIKQLWDDSIQEFSKQHQYATIVLPEPLREKFAQLIVKECINACGSDFGTQLIKQHFGITE